MQTALRKIGSSTGMIVPKSILVEAGIAVGTCLEMSVEDGRIVAAPIKKKVREGWAEEAAALIAAGEGGLLWPEFANDGDADLEW